MAKAIEGFLNLKSLDAQRAQEINYFSFKVQKCLMFKVLNVKKENFNGLALRYCSCTVAPEPVDGL